MRRSRSAQRGSLKSETLESRSVLAAVPWAALPELEPSELPNAGDTYAADLDGDTDWDMVVAGATGLAGWTNDGHGQFGTMQFLHTENWSVSQITSGDVDGDQRNDLIVGVSTRQNVFSPQIVWFRNLGAGQFAAPQTMSTGNIQGDIVVANLDSDRRSEVLFVKSTETSAYDLVRIELQENGFETQTIAQVAYSPVASADLDGDGDNDLLVKSSSQIAWYENTDGGWTQPVSHLIAEKEGVVGAMELADVDADGDQDVVAVANDGISVYGNDRGSFQSIAAIEPSLQFFGLTLADADRDGDVDIRSYSYQTRRSEWYLNANGGTQFSGAGTDSLESTAGMQVADLTGDGYAELIQPRGQWSMFTGNGANFEFKTSTVPYYAGSDSVAIGDMNGDGRQDLVTLSAMQLEVRLSQRGGSWSEPRRFSSEMLFGTLNLSDVLSLADVDGDGDIDVVTTGRIGSGPTDLVWVANDGNGNLGESRVIQPVVGAMISIFASFYTSSLLAAGDMDGDGDVDFATGDTNKIYLAENIDGRGTFTVRTLLEKRNVSIAVAEMDGDGDLDLVVGTNGYELPIWLENTGSNNFKPGKEIPGVGSNGVQAIDINRDGIWEVGGGVTSDLPPFSNFRSPTLRGYFDAAGDIDRDGDLDLVLNRRSIFFLTGGLWWDHDQGFNGTDQTLPASNRISRLIDMEGDGDLDIVGITPNRGLQFLRNELVSADLNDDGKIDAQDLDLLCRSEGTNPTLDFTNDGKVDSDDFSLVVRSVLGTTRGDANLDGVFNSRDLVEIFQQGLYETDRDAGWRSGDWNCDGRFSSDDLVAAFADGAYEQAKLASAADELAWAAELHALDARRKMNLG